MYFVYGLMALPQLGCVVVRVVVRSLLLLHLSHRVHRSKLLCYQIGHRYATCTCIWEHDCDVRLRHSRVAMTYLVANGFTHWNPCVEPVRGTRACEICEKIYTICSFVSQSHSDNRYCNHRF
jgi:hypothetical protein